MRFRKMGLLAVAVAMVMGSQAWGQTTYTWSNTGGNTAWYTATNWSPVPPSITWAINDTAQFANTGTATTSGINMGTASLSIGAIEVTLARTRELTIGNSSGTSGTLTLNGTTVNGIQNTILRNNSASALTLQNNETGTGKTMNIALGNSTNNIINVDGTGSIVISSNISGSNRLLTLNATSSGDLRLSGTNTWSGGTNINGGSGGGRLRIDATAALPTTGAVTISGGGRMTLNIAGTFGGTSQALTFAPTQTTNPSLDILDGAAVTWQGTIAINGDTRIEANGATGSLTFSGNVSGSGTLIKQSQGNLILSGTGNTATGGTQIGNGTLTVNSGSLLGTGAVLLSQTAGNNTALTLNNTAQSVGSLSSSFADATGTRTQIITLNGTALTINQSTDGTYGAGAVSIQSSTIVGSGSIIKAGNATLTLSSVNTYSGGTTVNAGTLTVTSTGSLGAGGLSVNNSNVGAGTDVVLNLNNAAQTVSSLSGTIAAAGSGANTATINLGTNTALIVNQSTNTTFAGVIAGNTGALIKSGAGTLTLSGVNTYGRITEITNGTLAIANSSALGTTGSIIFGGGILQYSGITTDLSGRFNSGASQAYLIDTNGNNVTFASGLNSFNGYLTKLGGGTLSLTVASNYFGATNINGGVLSIANAGALGTGGAINFGGGTLQYSGITTDLSARFSNTANHVYRINTNGNDVSFASNLTSSGGSLTKFGSGTLTLSGANTFDGGINLNGGGTLALGSSGAIGSAGAINFDGGTLQFSAANTTDYSARFSNASNQQYNLDTNGQAVTLASNLTSSGGSLTKSGSGTLTLSGANTYDGGTNLNGGTLALGSSGAIGSAGAIDFGGGTLQYSAANTADYSARFSNTANQQYRLDTNGQAVTLASNLTSSGGSLTKSGAGTLTLSGANTYTGGTNLNGGTLALGSSGAIGSTGLISFAGGSLQYSVSNTTDYSSRFNHGAPGQAYSIDTNGNNVSFATSLTSSGGSLTKTGLGTLTLTGANTYSGATNINGGTLTGTGSIAGATTVASGATISGSDAGLNLASSLTIAGNAAGGGKIQTVVTRTEPGVGTSTASILNIAGLLDLAPSNGTKFTIDLRTGGTPLNEFELYTVVIASAGTYKVGGVDWTNGSGAISKDNYNLTTDFTYGVFNDYALSINSQNKLQLTFTPVPEPGTMFAVGAGVLGLGGLIRRRFRKGSVEPIAVV